MNAVALISYQSLDNVSSKHNSQGKKGLTYSNKVDRAATVASSQEILNPGFTLGCRRRSWTSQSDTLGFERFQILYPQLCGLYWR